jgi:hypothetical protein
VSTPRAQRTYSDDDRARLTEQVLRWLRFVAVVLVMVGIEVGSLYTYTVGNRHLGQRNSAGITAVAREFHEFNQGNPIYVGNHERTQRLVCRLLHDSGDHSLDDTDCKDRP